MAMDPFKLYPKLRKNQEKKPDPTCYGVEVTEDYPVPPGNLPGRPQRKINETYIRDRENMERNLNEKGDSMYGSKFDQMTQGAPSRYDGSAMNASGGWGPKIGNWGGGPSVIEDGSNPFGYPRIPRPSGSEPNMYQLPDELKPYDPYGDVPIADFPESNDEKHQQYGHEYSMNTTSSQTDSNYNESEEEGRDELEDMFSKEDGNFFGDLFHRQRGKGYEADDDDDNFGLGPLSAVPDIYQQKQPQEVGDRRKQMEDIFGALPEEVYGDSGGLKSKYFEGSYSSNTEELDRKDNSMMVETNLAEDAAEVEATGREEGMLTPINESTPEPVIPRRQRKEKFQKDLDDIEKKMNLQGDTIYRRAGDPIPEHLKQAGSEYPGGRYPERRVMNTQEARAQMALQKIAKAALMAHAKRSKKGKKSKASIVFI